MLKWVRIYLILVKRNVKKLWIDIIKIDPHFRRLESSRLLPQLLDSRELLDLLYFIKNIKMLLESEKVLVQERTSLSLNATREKAEKEDGLKNAKRTKVLS